MGDRWCRRWVGAAVAAAMLNVSACGYLIFPERAGQPTGGRLDVSVVLLDSVGLLFGIIPGVVAFAVDLATGCIYLPPGPVALAPVGGAVGSVANWRPVAVVPPGADADAIAAALARQLAPQGRLRAPLRGDDIQWRTGPARSVAAR